MPIPERFGRYRVTGTLGAGAMGDVFAATDEALGREVAIKVLKSQRNELAARILDERFRQEARAIASLTHPNVVVVFDIGLDADPPYLVMERVAGPSLKERLGKGALPEAEVRALGIQIARALAAAHERGIVHRDVKPANILVAGEQTWKLADFGVAHVPDSSITMTGQFVGSPAYAPPEALLRGQCDREGDVFGLGAVLYHALAGTWPRLEQASGALLAPLPPVRTTAPGVSEALAAVIDRAVQVEPAQRPNASDLATQLAACELLVGVEGLHGVLASFGSSPSHVPSASNPSSASNHSHVPSASSAIEGVRPLRAISVQPADNASIASSPSAPGASSASELSQHPSLARNESPARMSSPTAVDSTPIPATRPGVPLDSTSVGVPVASVRWKPFAIGGAIFILLVILIGATRSGSKSSSTPNTISGPSIGGPTMPPPDEPIQIADPPMEGGKDAKDWRKVVENVQRGQFEEAREKLDEWERKYGATPETESLRAQLADRADVEDDRGPPGRRKHKHD